MLRKSFLLASFIVCLQPLWADEKSAANADKDEEQSADSLSDLERQSALEYSQKELQNKFQSGFGLDLGRVNPWSEMGLAVLAKTGKTISSLALGFGSFDYSGNLDQRNFLVAGHAESAFASTRWFFLGFGPLYAEPMLGLVHWSGDVKPRGNDDISDIEASSLTSRFDLIGLDLGASMGLMWIFKHGFFLDYNFMSFSRAILLQEIYSVSTTDARKAIRSQIAGPISMMGINLRVGYSYDF